MSEQFVALSVKDYSPEVEEPVLDSLFEQYEKVIVQSIITSFGLDLLITDRHGGDVDTIRNVRQIGIDSEMSYKNKVNEINYVNRGEYNPRDYHGETLDGQRTNFAIKKGSAREEYRNSGTTVNDTYVNNNPLHFLGKSKGADPTKNAELDHVVEASQIHHDRGRVLAGLDGRKLADAEENFAWTNKSLNASMGSWAHQKNEEWKRTHNGENAPLSELDMNAYIKAHPELNESTKQNMLNQYNKSRQAYEQKLARAYYTSPQFAKDVSVAAANVGVKMGIRQVFGFVFTEIWFAVKNEFAKQNKKGNRDLGTLLKNVGKGIKKGIENAKKKYKQLIDKFLSGSVAGVMSSLTTTLCNFFFTTAKNVVRIIRQTYASMVEAIKVLFINPDNYLLGERLRAVAKIVATGASVVVGTIVSEAIGKTAVGALPVVGDIIQTFCGAFVTGIMSCSLLYFLDRSKLINKLVKFLDNLPNIEKDVRYFKSQAEYFEKYAAQLMKIDIEKFRRETYAYTSLAQTLEKAKTEQELNMALQNAIKEIGITVPWAKYSSFNNFMEDKNAVMRFE